jgi:hypothetical protein
MSEPNAIKDRWRVESVTNDPGSYGGVLVSLYQVREPSPTGQPFIGYHAEIATSDPDLKAKLTQGAVVRLTIEPYPEAG